MHLWTILGIVHGQHSYGGKQGKLYGSCLSAIYDFGSIQFSETLVSDGYFCIFWTKKKLKSIRKSFAGYYK